MCEPYSRVTTTTIPLSKYSHPPYLYTMSAETTNTFLQEAANVIEGILRNDVMKDSGKWDSAVTTISAKMVSKTPSA